MRWQSLQKLPLGISSPNSVLSQADCSKLPSMRFLRSTRPLGAIRVPLIVGHPPPDDASRSLMSTRGPVPPSRCSTRTARWRRSAEAALGGFGGLAGADQHRRDRQGGPLLRATPHFGAPSWGPLTAVSKTALQIRKISLYHGGGRG